MPNHPAAGQAGLRLIRDAVMIRIRATNLEALLMTLLAFGILLGIAASVQTGFAGALGSVASAIGAVAGG